MSPCSASADRLPTDLELRAAYCIAILRQDLSLISQLVQDNDSRIGQLGAANAQSIAALREANEQLAQHRAHRETTFDRLRSYLLPKLYDLDLARIAAAHARGKVDNRSADNGVACLTACIQSGAPTGCVDRCSDRDLQARMDACRSPDWLPF